MTETPPSPSAQKPNSALRAAKWLIITFFITFTVLVSVLIVRGYFDVRERAVERATSASQVVATNARWIVAVAQQALRRMDSELGFEFDADGLSKLQGLEESISNLPLTAKAYIVAADGETLFTTDPNFQPIDIRDRPYFSELAQGKSFFTSSLLISRLDGSQIFAFSKRLERNGTFVGAAIISFDVTLLADFWLSLQLGTGSTVSLIRDDGMLVARFPLATDVLDLGDYFLFTELLPQNDTGTYSAVSPADNAERLVSYRTVPGTELIATAGLSLQRAYDQFWYGVFVFLGLVIPVLAALVIAAIWITRLLREGAERQSALAEALDTNTMLFNEIHHRVKNNLQSMLSLVRIQDLPAETKRDLESRFNAMAAVHEHMYQHDAYTDFDATEFVPKIVEQVLVSQSSDAKVTYDLQPISIKQDNATPLALLLNELVTNATKYAFDTRGDDGEIIIKLRQGENPHAELTVTDNGSGFDAETVKPGMGSRLIDGVIRQLNGEFHYEHNDGTSFHAEITLN